MKSLFAGMVARGWYPIHFFRLSFGVGDALGDKVQLIQTLDPRRFPADGSTRKIQGILEKATDESVVKALWHFEANVPYRFLNPWLNIQGQKNPATFKRKAILAAQQHPESLYFFVGEAPDAIRINEKWQTYLREHRYILESFTLWHLAQFVQKRNPNVPNIPAKLIQPDKREGLQPQKKLWREMLSAGMVTNCLFSGRPLKDDFHVDHFLPWKFVAHHQLWNLAPIHPAVNRKKSDQIPDLNRYLGPFVSVQKQALQYLQEKTDGFRKSSSLLEGVSVGVGPPQELLALSDEALIDRYRQRMEPLVQIAANMGFPSPWIYR